MYVPCLEKVMSESLAVKLQMIVSHSVGPRNQTWAPGRAVSACPTPAPSLFYILSQGPRVPVSQTGLELTQVVQVCALRGRASRPVLHT